MAKQDQLVKSKLLYPVGGMDESIQVVESDVTFAKVHGAAPFFVATLQRIFAKKLVDVNREQSVMGICQAFNTYGQYGYYVQSQQKLYYHLCEAPPNFAIDFVFPALLGVDEDNNSLSIYGQRQDGSVPPVLINSCLFGFPDRPGAPPDPGAGSVHDFHLNMDSIRDTIEAHPEYFRDTTVCLYRQTSKGPTPAWLRHGVLIQSQPFPARGVEVDFTHTSDTSVGEEIYYFLLRYNYNGALAIPPHPELDGIGYSRLHGFLADGAGLVVNFDPDPGSASPYFEEPQFDRPGDMVHVEYPADPYIADTYYVFDNTVFTGSSWSMTYMGV